MRVMDRNNVTFNLHRLTDIDKVDKPSKLSEKSTSAI